MIVGETYRRYRSRHQRPCHDGRRDLTEHSAWKKAPAQGALGEGPGAADTVGDSGQQTRNEDRRHQGGQGGSSVRAGAKDQLAHGTIANAKRARRVAPAPPVYGSPHEGVSLWQGKLGGHGEGLARLSGLPDLLSRQALARERFGERKGWLAPLM